MNLKELLWKVKFEDVKKSILNSYKTEEENIDAYHLVFKKLLMTTPKKFDKENYIIRIDWLNPDFDLGRTEGYWVIKINKENSGESYSFSLLPWCHWLPLKIDENVFENMSKEDVVAHCLWEMTFYGFNEEQQEKELEKILNVLEEIDEGLSWEDFKKELESELDED